MPQNILLIQDDPGDANAVREALSNSGNGPFQVEWVRSCSEGLQRLVTDGKLERKKANGFAAVLVDLYLPDSHGLATFDRLFRAVPQIPILVLSATQDEDVAKLAVQHGAQDYLLKARLDDYLLPKALDNMVERAAIAEERKRFEVFGTPSDELRTMLDAFGGDVPAPARRLLDPCIPSEHTY